MDLRGDSVASLNTCVGTSGSAGTYIAIRLGSCGISGSSISTMFGGTSCPSISTTGRSTFTSGSISGISISSFSSSASNPENYIFPSSESEPTPGFSTSPMRHPCLYIKVRSLYWSLPNVFMRAIIVSGMGIKSQFYRAILWPEFNAMDFYPPCIFSLGPR